MKTYVLGLDVGGTKIQAGLVDRRYRVVEEAQLPLDRSSREAALASIKRGVANFFSPAVTSIGVGITGMVDRERGLVVSSPNLPKGWQNVNLRAVLKKTFRRPVYLDNDANCIGLAEATVGAGKRYRSVLTLTIGTGIGAGLIIDQQIYRGWQGAIEFGHTVFGNQTPPCSCGRSGHLESVVSGPGISKLYLEQRGVTKSSYEVIALCRQKQPAARRVIRRVAQTLAVGLANAIHCYNPDVIVLNGGLSSVPEITKPALKSLKHLLLYPQLAKTAVVVSKLGYRAGVIGAAMLEKQYP